MAFGVLPIKGGITQLTGDVLAGPGTGPKVATVVGLQGNPVSNAAPALGNALVWNGAAWAPGAGGGGGCCPSIDVTQPGHAFTLVGEAAYFDGTSWLPAQANAVGTLGLGIVTNITANTFTVSFSGPLTGLTNNFPLEALGAPAPGPLTAGQYYFVSDSVAGYLTATEPATYSNPLLFALSVTEAVVLPYRPSATVASGNTTFVGLYNNRPPLANVGDQYFPTDGPFSYVWTSNYGGTWSPVIDNQLGLVPTTTTSTQFPPATTYTESMLAGSDSQRFETTDSNTTHVGAFFKGTLPAAPWTITAAISIDAFNTVPPAAFTGNVSSFSASGNYPSAGLVLGDGTNLLTWIAQARNAAAGGPFAFENALWSSTTNRSGFTNLSAPWLYTANMVWLRIRFDGAAYYCEWAPDGVTWRVMCSTPAATITPTDFGVCLQPWGATVAMNLYSLKVENV